MPGLPDNAPDLVAGSVFICGGCKCELFKLKHDINRTHLYMLEVTDIEPVMKGFDPQPGEPLECPCCGYALNHTNPHNYFPPAKKADYD